ncbi:hypothetical protein HNV12_16965 [Methanococcoides sp. SA1]|nr:hypothetical protein [Methanococcoides sp. SA1]
MMNKRGIVFAIFFGIIAIFLIFGALFTFGKMANTFTDNAGGVKVLDEKKVKVDDLFDYMDRYVELSEDRFVDAKGSGGSG